MASDFRGRAVEHRQHLLAQLISSIHRSHRRRDVDVDTLVDDLGYHLDRHEFNDFNTGRVSQKLADVRRLLSTNSQDSKASFLQDLATRKLAIVAADQDISTQSVLMLLFALSQNVLCSELPLGKQDVETDSPRSSPSPPPSSCSSSSLQEAYREAWDESDSLSDWDAPDQAAGTRLDTPETPQNMAEWLHDPALLHTANRKNLSREYNNLRASKMHLRLESATVPLPSEAVEPPQILQSPEVPLPAFESPAHHHDHLTQQDLVHLVLSRSGLLTQVSTQQLCFMNSAVALQCLEVLLDRADVMFSTTTSTAPWSSILRTCSSPRCPTLRPLAHTRCYTHAALMHVAAPFLRAAQQRAAMLAWVSEVSRTAGVGSSAATLPPELKSDGVLNPSIAAFVIAIGQQLDVVDAAINELQVVVQEEVEAGDSAGCVMRMYSLAHPTMRRLAFLYATFTHTIQKCLNTGRQPLSKVSQTHGGVPAPRRRGSSSASGSGGGGHVVVKELPAKISQAAMDTLYKQVLQLDQAAGRDGAVLRAITLHLLVSCMRPSVEAMHTMLQDGALIGLQSHLCVRMDSNVSVHHPDFWSGSVVAETPGGAALVPACLQGCVRDVSAGAKAAAVLHAHRRSSSSSAAAAGRRLAAQNQGIDRPPFFRLVDELTKVVQAPNDTSAAEAEEAVRPHKLTALLHTAGELLADMHREGACAADALAAMIEAMDDTAFRADRGEGALGPVLQQPGYLTPAAVLPPEAGDPGGEGVQKRTTSPLQVVGGTVSHLPGDADPVGVAEKVAWMDSKDQAHGAPMEPPEGQDPLASSAAGMQWGNPDSQPVLHASQEETSVIQRGPPRVSLPPTTIAGGSELGTMPGDAASLSARQADLQSEGGLGHQPVELEVPHQHDEDHDGFTDTSSDFSYGSSDGSGAAEDAEERLVLRQARKALQVARKEARKAHEAERFKGRIPSPQQLFCHEKGAEGSAEAPLTVIKTTSDWDRIDGKLFAAAQAGSVVPSVDVEAPGLHAPSGGKHVCRSMKEAEELVRANAANLDYSKTDAGARSMAQMLPGCTSLPAFTPVQGTEAVGEWMTKVYDAGTIRQQGKHDAAASQLNGSHWQLSRLKMDSPPMQLALKECLQCTLLQRSSFPGQQLASLILGPCDLMAELRQLRSVMLMGSTHMCHWSRLLATELNSGLKLSKPDDNHTVKLQRLEAQLQEILIDGGVMDNAEIVSRQLSVVREASSRGGLRAASERAAKHRLLSHLAHLRVRYTIRWPLNVIIHQDQLKTYQDILPALLQVYWAKHSLNDVSELLRSLPPDHALPEVMRQAFRQRGDLHGSRYRTASAAQTAAHMRHVLNAFQHTMFHMAVDTAWNRLCATLQDASARAAADATSVDLETVARAHKEYLDAVFRACWLSKDQNSQVVGGSLHEMLDTMLLFCVAVKKALGPASASADEMQEKYVRRASAQACVKAANLFTSQIHQLVVSLSQCNLKVVSGSEVTWLLETLNFGGFYDSVLQ